MSGIFGVVTRKKGCQEDLFYGTDYHSHLGTQFAGLAVYNGEIVRKIHDIRGSQFKAKFFADYSGMHGSKGIGVISALDEQPIVVHSRFGAFAIVANGFIENAAALARQLYAKGQSFSEVTRGAINMPELIAKLIIQGASFTDGIERMFGMIKGSCSLLLLTREGIYAARDARGSSALALGERGGDWAVTSETAAFYNLGFKIKKYLQPGEILLLNDAGPRPRCAGCSRNRICSFLWVYTGFPASSYEGINVEMARERCGRALARHDSVEADMVAGIPDSGSAHAIGYAMESGVPLRRPLVKYTPGFDRSYTPPSQAQRDLIARMKLIPIPDIIRDKSIVFCDDSIVRGTQLKNYTIQKLRECGARQVHLRIACPPLMFPCQYNYSTRTLQELAARRAIRALEKKSTGAIAAYLDEDSAKYRAMVDWIARDLGATTLVYQRLDDMVAAIGLPPEQLCQYCWTGKV